MGRISPERVSDFQPGQFFVGQFKSLVIWVLIGAAVVSTALGETVDGIVIIAIVILNVPMGFIQEYCAEKAAAALADMVAASLSRSAQWP